MGLLIRNLRIKHKVVDAILSHIVEFVEAYIVD